MLGVLTLFPASKSAARSDPLGFAPTGRCRAPGTQFLISPPTADWESRNGPARFWPPRGGYGGAGKLPPGPQTRASSILQIENSKKTICINKQRKSKPSLYQ
jgi:hypothetical protein